MRLREEKKIGLHMAVRSRSRGLRVDEDKHSSCRHVVSGKPFDRRHLSHILRTWLFDDRVDLGPRDLRRPDRKVIEQEGRIHAFKGKFGPKIVAD